MRAALLLVLAIFAGLSAAQGVSNAIGFSGDLHWDEGRFLLRGLNPYAIYLDAPEAGTAVPHRTRFEPVQLPSVLLLSAPVALLDLEAAKVAWIAANVVATGVFVFLILILFLPSRKSLYLFAILTFLLLTSTPWRVTINNGQNGIIAMVFFLVAVFFYDKKRLVLTIIFCSLALIKYTLIIPFFAYFIHRPRDSLVVISSVTALHAILTVLTSVMVGTDPLTLIHQSLDIARSLSGQGAYDFFAFFSWLAPNQGTLVPILCSLIVVMTILAIAQHRLDLRGLSILSIASIIIIYHRNYDAFVLLILCLHLYKMIQTSPTPILRMCPTSDLVEIAAGISIVTYVFFGERLVMQMIHWNVLHEGSHDFANAIASGAIYAYFLFLCLQLNKKKRHVQQAGGPASHSND